MNIANLDRRFFESTRGRVVVLLRRRDLTVNDLADEMGLTDNAVRAHLLSLERDGLVVQKGTIKGFRKPHYVYGLSHNAREIFPRPYGLLFNRLLSFLRKNGTKAGLISKLREVGRSIGTENAAEVNSDIDSKLEHALTAIESLGGSASISNIDGELFISSESCPFAEAVTEHPEVCKVTESIIGEIIRAKVSEACDRTSSPKCRFLVELISSH